MTPSALQPKLLRQWIQVVSAWLAGWARVVKLGATLLVLVLSPSTYAAQHRPALVHRVYSETVPLLAGFTLLCALISLLLTRIVLATAVSFGLTQYAMQVVIRVLVLELVPLATALYVAVRCTLPSAAELARMRRKGELDAQSASGQDPLYNQVLPRVVAGVFASAMLAALSGVVTLVLVYITVYGFSTSGLAAYTRMFGQVFSPTVTLIFFLKTLLSSMTVALIPVASALYDPPSNQRTSAELRALVRMLAVILVIEAVALMGNYY
jgi:phospholipid/cholesterol/gamma-HCH transport system permease protein